MKKTIIYSMLASSLLLNMGFVVLINDVVNTSSDILDENIKLNDEVYSLENQYELLEKENVELSEQVIIFTKECNK